MFFNLRKSRETFDENSNSRKNIDEAQFAVNLYLTLKHSSPLHLITGQVGVITPYSQQQSELRHVFQEALGDQYTQEVEINTVDGFQGREKDIIICTCIHQSYYLCCISIHRTCRPHARYWFPKRHSSHERRTNTSQVCLLRNRQRIYAQVLSTMESIFIARHFQPLQHPHRQPKMQFTHLSHITCLSFFISKDEIPIFPSLYISKLCMQR